MPSERFNPMLGCPECETPGPMILLAWPSRSNGIDRRRYKLARRYYACIACGFKTYAYGEGEGAGMKRIFTEEQVEQVAYYYRDCLMTSGEIATIMHCFPTTVRKYLRESGVQMRPKGGKRKKALAWEVQQRIRYLYWECELTTEEVGEQVSMSASSVRYYMARYGIPRRSYREGNLVAIRRGRNGLVNHRASQDGVSALPRGGDGP